MQDFVACKVPFFGGTEPKLFLLKRETRKIVLVMKITAVLLLAAVLQVSAKSWGQERITLSFDNAPLETVLKNIQSQANVQFIYRTDYVKDKKVTISVSNATLKTALDLCLKNFQLTYDVFGTNISIHPVKKEGNKSGANVVVSGGTPPLIDVHGRVVNEKGDPVEGVTVSVKGSTKSTTTDKNGEFSMATVDQDAVLVFTHVSMEAFEVKVSGKAELSIRLKAKISALDELQVIAYGTTSKRFNTGDVVTIKEEDISKQSITNPLAALEGRVPGLFITPKSGVPGSAFKVQLRGQSSVGTLPGSLPSGNPLFIVDGVPFAPNNLPFDLLNSSTTGTGGLSPLTSINPSDIASIEVLKDADATAIYGSRGANGVILITTKKGVTGKTQFNFNVYTGENIIGKRIDFLNTAQYVGLRKEALANDGLALNATNAPDLVLWDTTRYTDLNKQLLSQNAHITDVEGSMSWGNPNTQFLLGSGYHREGNLFPGNFHLDRGSMHVSINHVSNDRKFTTSFSASYSVEKNNLTVNNLAAALFLPPNIPDLYDATGKLNWSQNGYNFGNPMAYLLQPFLSRTNNLLGNFQVGYEILPHLVLRSSFGYNTFLSDQQSQIPISSQDPSASPAPTGNANFGTNEFRSWIVEPQAEYKQTISKGKMTFLVGGSWQQTNNDYSTIYATGYANDALLGTLTGATQYTPNSNSIQYNYEALFGRLTYNWDDKYILNFSGRRDGSSRFGPGNKFGNFGAVGGAWIFTNEKFIKKLPFLNFGKLRASYGTTGNDQIGDYKFFDSWSSTPYSYYGVSGLYPIQLVDSTFRWEVNKKLEFGTELSFAHERILLSASWFQNRSSNQLINEKVSSQTGFGVVAAVNFPAVVQNTGWEFSLQTKNISNSKLTWRSNFTLTIPKNKLLSFPNLASSSYASFLIEGQSLNVQRLYHYTGVDPTSGLFTFLDVNKDTSITYPADATTLKNLDPKFYGGLENTFTYKGFTLSFFFQFTKQLGYNYLNSLYSLKLFYPGAITNQPTEVLSHWQKPGDEAALQKLTVTSGTPAYNALNNFIRSDGVISDASFLRLRTLSLSYSLPASWIHAAHLQTCRFYLQGQNLLTITSYKVTDPQMQNIRTLPLLKTITGGLQLNF